MAIKATLIFNNTGKPRIMQWYQQMASGNPIVSPESACNFLEGSALIGGNDTKIIYRHYATLYFVFVVDSSESELGILDLIQVLVEVLDKAFVNVCELDLIFRPDDVSSILSEIVSGGMVLETNLPNICDVLTAKNEINLRTR
ncbi:hypothetical protein CcCBS67573_g06548 [Chytriomyces confervae]|uniref:AP complex subunit sigma n=1 Tax=Chytriomyces confervae TaxID=246404 RepID=A0A507F2K1_9FUNG|nr:hypothetical protein CcCBS67573_g06548 [Chytriomyces confervae]